MKEWIEHYLNQGAEHFYLINDNSTDNTLQILEPYIELGLVTLYTSLEPQPHYLGYQRAMYNQYILPHLNKKDTKWLLMCDLDEFVWSPKFPTLEQFLRDYVHSLAQVQITPFLFGSNNLEKQPSSLVQGFTKRLPIENKGYKYFVNSEYTYVSLNVHHATPENPEYQKPNHFMVISQDYIRLNHYICQSRELWLNVKCARGDADGYLQRSLEMFEGYESIPDQIDDFELAELNKHLYTSDTP
jgi:hypothetical protein